ncbi:hypothetical protein QFZ38_000754 [Pseudomonas cedrina]|nr:hypothetical protein [Pseudomonas cedrina]
MQWQTHRLRRQASSHRDCGCSLFLASDTSPLWERACSRKRWTSHRCSGRYTSLRRQASSHRDCGCSPLLDSTQNHCGSGLARESGGSVTDAVADTPAFAGKPAPTGIVGVHLYWIRHKTTVGLARESGGPVIDAVADTPPSQASQLPQGLWVFTFIGFDTKPLWERACSRKRWISHRCSGRYTSLRRQASSHRDCGCSPLLDSTQNHCGACSRKRWASHRCSGRHTAFAGKPAPTGIVGVHLYWIRHKTTVGAGLPAMAVGQLPMQWQTHRLRRQASSHRDCGCSPLLDSTQNHCGACSRKRWASYRCSGRYIAFAGKPAPTGIVGVHLYWIRHKTTVGAGLLAKAVGQS